MRYLYFLLLILSCGLIACKKEKEPERVYKGVTPPVVPENNTFIGTSWELYQYKDETITTPQPRTDTLFFEDRITYTYNGFQRNYNLTTNAGGVYTLDLYGTPFGHLSGTVPIDAIDTHGEIINKEFIDVTSGASNKKYYLWLKRL
jgi:hypothetical protein